jgi:hypothetical protein
LPANLPGPQRSLAPGSSSAPYQTAPDQRQPVPATCPTNTREPVEPLAAQATVIPQR